MAHPRSLQNPLKTAGEQIHVKKERKKERKKEEH
jgi:hypothetical protein